MTNNQPTNNYQQQQQQQHKQQQTRFGDRGHEHKPEDSDEQKERRVCVDRVLLPVFHLCVSHFIFCARCLLRVGVRHVLRAVLIRSSLCAKVEIVWLLIVAQLVAFTFPWLRTWTMEGLWYRLEQKASKPSDRKNRSGLPGST